LAFTSGASAGASFTGVNFFPADSDASMSKIQACTGEIILCDLAKETLIST
jgi:hypothetical protein